MWRAAATCLVTGIVLRLVVFESAWWDSDGIAHALLGLGGVLALVATWRTGPSVVWKNLRDHPFVLAVVAVFILSVVAAFVVPDPN